MIVFFILTNRNNDCRTDYSVCRHVGHWSRDNTYLAGLVLAHGPHRGGTRHTGSAQMHGDETAGLVPHRVALALPLPQHDRHVLARPEVVKNPVDIERLLRHFRKLTVTSLG